ncbi:NADP-dependent oxidoreductase [Pseudomonas aeruginosa]|uniref:NADP-dependent oxidoreductase n=1 Tax=Pseudomonas aeruginosa TaxID=287 RepID=UPI000F891401|nr:NADP-dependent oxidoreductase [Pseudomonas aeruginosa]RUH94021.1 NADP-dependent oxidoreductase [Pseudomonas aeruginosa]
MSINRRFLLTRRPIGNPVFEDFKLVEEPIPTLQPGSLIVRNHYLSLDPAQRLWMDDGPNPLPPIRLGDPVRAASIGVVYESDNSDFQVGDWVVGLTAMEDYSIIVEPNEFTTKVDISSVDSPTRYLSIMGAVGFTAYFGLLTDGKPQPGETVVISAAAGAVGSVAGQIAKIMGCRVVGIAGGPEKCRRLINDYGFDIAIDYRGKNVETLAEEIQAAAPEGVNIVFENVGGFVLDAELRNIADFARIILCGMISEYNAADQIGTHNLRPILDKSATLKGFRIASHAIEFAQAGPVMAKWVNEGRLHMDEDIQEGLENSYLAFMRLFSGENTGKLILKIT